MTFDRIDRYYFTDFIHFDCINFPYFDVIDCYELKCKKITKMMYKLLIDSFVNLLIDDRPISRADSKADSKAADSRADSRAADSIATRC